MRCFMIALAMTAAPLSAAPAPHSPAAVDPARLATANRLLDAIHYDSLAEKTTTAMTAEVERSLPARLETAAGEPIPDELKAKLVSLITSFMKRTVESSRANVRKGTALIYAKHFTTAEMERLIELQSDPIMAKMQAELPEIMTEAMALSQAAVQSEMPRLVKELQQSIEQYQKNTQPGT